MPKAVAIAIGAHPDDIEFYMAGTLVFAESLILSIDKPHKVRIRTI